jgi:hypothetical protein
MYQNGRIFFLLSNSMVGFRYICTILFILNLSVTVIFLLCQKNIDPYIDWSCTGMKISDLNNNFEMWRGELKMSVPDKKSYNEAFNMCDFS